MLLAFDISSSAAQVTQGDIRYYFATSCIINGSVRSLDNVSISFDSGAIPNSFPSSFPSPPVDLPAFPTAINGHEFVIPGQSTGSDAPIIDYADVQIWVDQYIDPTNADNLAKFRTTGGKAVPPSVAADAFGTQTFLFSGNAEGFANNTGSGGDFTKTGTVTDYTPGP
jgi:hypothetical protein